MKSWSSLHTETKVLIGTGALAVVGIVYLIMRARADARGQLEVALSAADLAKQQAADPGPSYNPPQYVPNGPGPSQAYIPPGGPLPSTFDPLELSL